MILEKDTEEKMKNKDKKILSKVTLANKHRK